MQSHQCDCISQSVQQSDEYDTVSSGCEIGGDGQDSIRGLNQNVVFKFAVRPRQELSEFVKQQQIHIFIQNQT